MRLLLDTHVVLWQLSGVRELSTRAQERIAGADDLLFSTVSFAEIGIKASVGKLEVPEDLKERVTAAGIRVLTLSPAHGLGVAGLPVHHRDPFDRLIIAQALSERLAVVTADERFQAYGVDLVPA